MFAARSYAMRRQPCVLGSLPYRIPQYPKISFVSFPRFLSTCSEEDINKAKAWLLTFKGSEIPRDFFDISYSRSSGAGGQKVNKTSSKATVALEDHRWLDPQFCYWIPKAVRTQLSEKKIRYETKMGGLLIQSDASRNRDVNTDECFRKLADEIKNTTYFAEEVSEEDKQRWEEIRADRKEKRMFNKKRQSDKKKGRSKNFDY